MLINLTNNTSFRYDINLDKKMVRKKIDNRVRLLIENGVAEGRRSMFVVVGDKARDQVGFCSIQKKVVWV